MVLSREQNNHLWIPTRGFENVDAYPIPKLPIVCRRQPTYAPPGMCTEPVSFPSIVTGHDSGPVEVARHGPPTCCTAAGVCRCMDGHFGFKHDVARELDASRRLTAELEAESQKKKAEYEACLEASSRLVREKTHDLKDKINGLKSKLEKLLLENTELQNLKRQLQSAEQAVKAPQLIAQNCIRLRAARQGVDLRNDDVDELLAEEVYNCEDCLTNITKCLDQIDYQLLQARRMQHDVEQFTRTLEWAVQVDRSDRAVLRIGQADDLRSRFACLVARADAILKSSQDWRGKAKATMENASKRILTKWCATSRAFETNIAEIKLAMGQIKCSACKIKNELINVEKNLKYLKTNSSNKSNCYASGNNNHNSNSNDKETSGGDDDDDVEQLIKRAVARLASLSVTKNNLDAELVSKHNSLFVDEHKCMTMRKTYPILILWKCLHETIL